MTLRKFLFWCHLAAGVSAGIVIFIMSVTGVLLTYERQIIALGRHAPIGAAPPSASGATPADGGDHREGLRGGAGHGVHHGGCPRRSSAPVGLGARRNACSTSIHTPRR